MALHRAKILWVSRRTFCSLSVNPHRCFTQMICVGKTSQRLHLLNASTLRLTPCCGLKYSSRHLATLPDLSDKPWYQRWAIKSNDKFIAQLERISPKAAKQYVQLVEGAKLFFYDAKHVYRLRQRMKEEKLQLSDLDWRDIYIKKHIYKDFSKVLPTFLLMCLPFVFYIILPILFFYPRPFLSDQFFTREQLLEFNSRFQQTRLAVCPSIISQLIKSVKKLPDSTVSQSFLSTMERLNSDMPIDSRNLLEHRDLFEVVLAHKTLPRIHLVNLCRVHSLKSFLLPSSVLRSRLSRTLTFIHAMDKALLKENLQGLSQQDLEKLCFERGLYSYDVDRAVLAAWLQDWVYLSTNLTENEQSLLSHAAVLLVKGQSTHKVGF